MTIPNQLTITRIVLTPIFAILFLANNKVLNQVSLLIFFIAALTDWYDGWLARKFNYISNLGKFLDPLADKILTSTAFFCFVAINMLDFYLVLIIVIRDILVTLLRVYAQYKNHVLATSFLAKVKTSVQMIFLYYLLVIYIGLEKELFKFIDKGYIKYFLHSDLIKFSMYFITLITVYTGFSYFYTNRYTIKEIFK